MVQRLKKTYIKKLNAELSLLGFGIARLPMTADGWFPDSAFSMIDRSMELGINYYDTGWIYQSGKSEEFAREALVKRYKRDSFYLAAKLPLWQCQNKSDMEQIFEKQIENLGVEYMDFYLVHALNVRSWERGKRIGLIEFLDEKRKNGQIKRMGFSLHDTSENLQKIIDDYNWEFVQLQINYYDWIVLHAEKLYKIAAEREIPCFTMETVGGGRLSALPKEAQEIYEEIRPGKSAASWAIKFVASLSNVAVMLSGMNTIEQLEDNVQQCLESATLSRSEKGAVERVVNIIRSKECIPCTGCKYCLSECPKEINIPEVFECYNDYKLFGSAGFFDWRYYVITFEGNSNPATCIRCGKCMQICTQKINIPDFLEVVRDFAYSRALGFDLEEVKVRLQDKNLVCFGSGLDGIAAKKIFGNLVKEFVFCDNDSRKWDKQIEGIDVISSQRLWEIYQENEFVILISSRNYREPIQKQLLQMGIRKESILNPL